LKSLVEIVKEVSLSHNNESSNIKIEKAWAMASKNTFSIPPIKKLIDEEIGTAPGTMILDPFPFESKIDCFEYFEQFKDESMVYGLIDPEYSLRQRSEHYKKNKCFLKDKTAGWHTSAGWTSAVKDEVARIIKPGGKTITFGWNSSGIGMKRGFIQTRILLVAHGGDHNDTICTVEVKV